MESKNCDGGCTKRLKDFYFECTECQGHEPGQFCVDCYKTAQFQKHVETNHKNLLAELPPADEKADKDSKESIKLLLQSFGQEKLRLIGADTSQGKRILKLYPEGKIPIEVSEMFFEQNDQGNLTGSDEESKNNNEEQKYQTQHVGTIDIDQLTIKESNYWTYDPSTF